MSFQDIIKLFTRDIMDPSGSVTATCKVEVLHIDGLGNRSYKALAIKDTDIIVLRVLYQLSAYVEIINPGIKMVKIIDGSYQDLG
jgi:hypothetical protein